MMALGIYSFIRNVTDFDLPVMFKCAWLTIFGFLLGLAESRELEMAQSLLGHMEFLLTYFGRGLFAFYVGTICIDDSTLANSSTGSTVIGVVLCAIGVLNLTWGCA